MYLFVINHVSKILAYVAPYRDAESGRGQLNCYVFDAFHSDFVSFEVSKFKSERISFIWVREFAVSEFMSCAEDK